MAKVTFVVLLLVLIICTTNSCKKTTESELNGLWILKTVTADTASSNYLNAFPGYAGCGNCNYKLSFQESDVVIGYYISNDSIKHIATGTWTVPTYGTVVVKVDNFIDGTFSITRPLLSHWILTSNQNHIAAFDNGVNPVYDTCYTKLDMYKE